MKTKLRFEFATVLLLFATLVLPLPTIFAQGTAITHQGQLLSNGTNAPNGNYVFEFTLWSAVTNGSQQAGPVTNSPVGVTNGLFTTLIDFGAGVFTGESNWLQIAVGTNLASLTNLAPRVQLAPTPYAIYAENGAAAASLASGVALGSGLGNSAGANTSDDFIGGGLTNTIQALNNKYSVIVGGDANTILSADNESFIGGGTGNSIQTISPEAAIVGGGTNTILTGPSAFIGGGSYNTNSSTFATVGGGQQNTIQSGADHATIGGGSFNTIQSSASVSTIGRDLLGVNK